MVAVAQELVDALAHAGRETQALHEALAVRAGDEAALVVVEEAEAVRDGSVLLACLGPDGLDELREVRLAGALLAGGLFPVHSCRRVVVGGLVPRLDVRPQDGSHLEKIDHAVMVDVQNVEEAVGVLLCDVQHVAELAHFRAGHCGVVVLVEVAEALLHGPEALRRLPADEIAKCCKLLGAVLAAALGRGAEGGGALRGGRAARGGHAPHRGRRAVPRGRAAG
mmetsp:Transcript_129730/g.403459  ORF Transcript_129730/g.403459 Transcript_129730/m.403459 type:complete len:223 (-) Transcript_129730:83-751(-)